MKSHEVWGVMIMLVIPALVIAIIAIMGAIIEKNKNSD